MSTQLNQLLISQAMKLPSFQDLSPNSCKISFEPQNKTMIQSMTVAIRDTYRNRNPKFTYETSYNPKRVLTKLSEPTKNNGFDNAKSDYILYVHGFLGPAEDPRKYLILDMLGSGTFGQVVKCQNRRTGEMVAIKVVKNKRLYTRQGIIEDSILCHLNSLNHPDKVLNHKESFMHENHVCLVFELLSVNLFEVLKQRDFNGLSIELVRNLSRQLLETLSLLKSLNIIHCDLKPENILLKDREQLNIKVIDFGSSCYVSQQSYSYIQSRFYRAPEVLLGSKYSTAIDMWSFGCIVAELFLGLPILPGNSEYNQLLRITETIGNVPEYMIRKSEKKHKYYNYKNTFVGASRYTLKSAGQYSQENKTNEVPSRRFFTSIKLDDLIMNAAIPKDIVSFGAIEKEKQARRQLLDLLKKTLEIDPSKRLSPEEALQHPFMTGA